MDTTIYEITPDNSATLREYGLPTSEAMIYNFLFHLLCEAFSNYKKSCWAMATEIHQFLPVTLTIFVFGVTGNLTAAMTGFYDAI
jgi:hypothetical protein